MITAIRLDSFNSSKLILLFREFDAPWPTNLKNYLKNGFDSPIVQVYYQILVKIAVLFGADKQRAEKEMKAALQLEIKLANLTMTEEQKKNASAVNNVMPLSEVQRLFPEVPLVQYIKAIIGVDVTEEEVVNVESPDYITKDIYL